MRLFSYFLSIGVSSIFATFRRGFSPTGFGEIYSYSGKILDFYRIFQFWSFKIFSETLFEKNIRIFSELLNKYEVSPIVVGTLIYQPHRIRRKYELNTKNMKHFSEFLRCGVTPIYAKILIYQPHRVRKKYKLIAKNMRLFSEFLSFPVSSIFSKSSKSQSWRDRRTLKLCGKNMGFFTEFSKSEVSKIFSKTLVYPPYGFDENRTHSGKI